MKTNLKSNINDFFARKPSKEQKSWSVINQFYHMILTKMENDNISRSDLARKLNKSRSSVSQMFNKTPNLTIKKMIEIADSVDININLTTETFLNKQESKSKPVIIVINRYEESDLIDYINDTSSITENKYFSHTVACNNYHQLGGSDARH